MHPAMPSRSAGMAFFSEQNRHNHVIERKPNGLTWQSASFAAKGGAVQMHCGGTDPHSRVAPSE